MRVVYGPNKYDEPTSIPPGKFIFIPYKVPIIVKGMDRMEEALGRL